MLSTGEMHRLHEDLFDRMLAAGWVKKHTFTQGKGWHVGWTTKGANEALYLKTLRHDLDLGAADERPVIASILAHGVTPDPRSNAETINAALRPFLRAGLLFRGVFVHGKYCEVSWTKAGEEFCARLCGLLDELKIEMADEDRLMALFSIAEGWAPDVDTKIVIE